MVLPREIVHQILQWTYEFHRRDAMDRMATFATHFGLGENIWGQIMNDVRANVPRYSVTLHTENGYELGLSIFSPNCNPAIWNERALGSSFLKFRRRALACGGSYTS